MARFEGTGTQTSGSLPTPVLLRRGLELIVSGSNRRYLAVRDKVTGKVNSFTEAEIYILEQLSLFDDFHQLQWAYSAKFATELTEDELAAFITAVNQAGLWGTAAMKHPIVGGQLHAASALLASYRQGRKARGMALWRLRKRRLALASAQHKQIAGAKLISEPANSKAGGVGQAEGIPVFIGAGDGEAEDGRSGNAGARGPWSSRGPSGAESANNWSEHDFEECFSVPSPDDPIPEAGADGEFLGGKSQFQSSPPRAKSRQPSLHLFNPEPLFDALLGIAVPLGKLCLWLIPFLLVNSVFLIVNHAENISYESYRLFGLMSFLEHMVISLFAVNLLSVVAMGFVARSYHVPTPSFSLVLFLKLLPRFFVVAAVTPNSSKKIRVAIAVTPLLVKLFLVGAGFFLWYLTRSVDNALSLFFFNLAGMSLLAFVFTLNPLFPANGYYLLTLLLKEPQLQERSLAALRARLTGKPLPVGTGSLFAVYGLCCLLFNLVLIAFLLGILARFLHFNFDTTGITVFAVILVFTLIGFLSSLRASWNEVGGSPAVRPQQSQALMRGQTMSLTARRKKGRSTPLRTALKIAVVMGLAVVMYLPYDYSANGSAVIKPLAYQEITTDMEGIVKAVYFDGGEFVSKGELLAKFESSEAESRVKILNARINSQKAMLDNLRARPTPEQLQLAQRALDVELTKLGFSKENLSRKRAIYRKSVISLEEFQNAQRAYHVDLGNVASARANLELVEAGATDEEILAVESELQRWTEERDLFQNQVDRSYLYMPIDGKILTLYLKQKVGQFQEEGEPFAEVENTSQVLAEIEIPEVDIGVVAVGSPIQVRVWSYHDELFQGEVVNIDPNVEKQSFGNVIKVITLLENEQQRLKTGMTGYAKISGETRPVWEVLFLTIKRFVLVEMWSWLP